MIAIIDYGMGNLRSVSKAFEAMGHQAVVTREARVIADASHVACLCRFPSLLSSYRHRNMGLLGMASDAGSPQVKV
jgi:hypothetical protein